MKFIYECERCGKQFVENSQGARDCEESHTLPLANEYEVLPLTYKPGQKYPSTIQIRMADDTRVNYRRTSEGVIFPGEEDDE